MMRTIGMIALCAAVLTGATPAQAAPPKTKLQIIIATEGEPKRGATLRCNPDGGNHPNPRAACDVLRGVGGNLDRLHVPADTACGQEVKPYVVVVAGHWRGKRVQWSKGYRNACAMRAAGGKLLTS